MSALSVLYTNHSPFHSTFPFPALKFWFAKEFKVESISNPKGSVQPPITASHPSLLWQSYNLHAHITPLGWAFKQTLSDWHTWVEMKVVPIMTIRRSLLIYLLAMRKPQVDNSQLLTLKPLRYCLTWQTTEPQPCNRHIFSENTQWGT